MNNNDIIPGFDEERVELDTLEINLQKADTVQNCVVLHLLGRADEWSASFFPTRLAKIIDSGFNKLIFDLSGAEELSALFVGVFISTGKVLERFNGDIVLIKLKPEMYELLDLLDSDHYVIISGLGIIESWR
jgi:anti-anti-sigma regulatory factor